MRSLLALLAAGTFLGGCATRPADMPPPPESAVVPQAPVAPVAAPKPTYGSFGFDETGVDPTVAPGNDFFGYASGTWAKNTEIPADKSRYGMFNVLDDLSKERTRTIIEEQAKAPNSRIGAAYESFMNEAAVEAKGLAPLEPWLNEIRGVDSKAQLDQLYAKADEIGISGPFRMYVGQDEKSPDVYAITMLQGGLGMPDRDYYLSKDPKLVDTRAKYLEHLTNVLTLAGEKNAAARAKAILDYEAEIAKVHWTRSESRDSTKTYNKITLAELERKAPGFDFSDFVHGTGANVDYVIVAQPSAFTGEAAAIQKAPLSVLKDQLLVKSIDAYSSYLPKAFDQEHFDFYGTVLSGTPEQQPRWKRAVNFTVGALGDDVSKLYVAKYFPPETKAAADELVHNIIAAMGRRIDALDWMSPQTKAKAHAKLAAFTPKIGYPSQWRDMSGLAIDANDLLGNAMRSNRFDHAYELGKLGGPIRRWEWGMTPMTINAYANPTMVEIVFPAAILQPPFFDPNADPAVNYGGIGAVIGHELSHHFDDQGAKYDSTGKLIDWWNSGRHEGVHCKPRQVREADQFVRAASRDARQRQAHHGRKRRRPCRPDRRSRCLYRVAERRSAAGDRRDDGGPALLLGLGAGVALQEPRAGASPAIADRPAFAMPGADRRRSQHGSVVSGFRRQTRPGALPCSRGPGAHLVGGIA